MVNEDSFSSFAARTEREAERRGSYVEKEYEKVKWCGLQKGVPAIIRFVGNAPDYDKRSATDATSRYISWIVDDAGKRMKLVRKGDGMEMVNRFVTLVTKSRWDNVARKKIYYLEEKDPELFNLLMKNGLSPNDPQYKYQSGVQGKEVTLFNVISRADYDWHKANKHTMLLASNINTKGDAEFVTEGVSKFGIEQPLAHLFEAYRGWDYDISLTKTGLQSPSLLLTNASRVPEEVPKAYRDLIVNGPLTAEEESWERYDLDKLYPPTSCLKLYNRLKNTIKRLDVALGTNFLDELKLHADREKAELDKLNAEKDAPKSEFVSPDEFDLGNDESAPAPIRRTVADAIVDPSQLPYFVRLSPKDKTVIAETFVSAVKGEGKKYSTTWASGTALSVCPNCENEAPEDSFGCPFCGATFC